MMTEKRHHKKAILQYHSNRYTLTIPSWFVDKVLCAKKGSVIKFDQIGGKVTLENIK